MSWTKTEIAIGVAVCAVIPLALWAAIENERNWQEFAVANDCKVIREVASKTVHTSGYDSQGRYVSGTTTIPGSKTWRCRDETEYTR